IEYLWREAHGEATLNLPEDEATRWKMYRGLTNVRAPQPIADTYLDVQDAYLQAMNRQHVTHIDTLSPMIGDDVFLWQGDITQLKVDGIVNAANSQLLGCFE
ncbi:protein-ADP-ribose hydrolase, partial [Staphylococcus aureus]